MDAVDSEFGYLVESTNRSISLLRGCLPQKAPTRRGSVLRGHIEFMLGGIETRLANAVESFGSAPIDDQLEYVKRVRLLNSLCWVTHRAVPWLEEAEKPKLPLGALYFIDDCGRRICRTQLDAVPTASDGFSTEPEPFRDLFERLQLDEPEGPQPVLLNYPRLEINAHLLLPLYAHELGHSAVQKNDLARNVLKTHASDDPITKAFDLAEQELVDAGRTRSESAELLARRAEQWVTELVCDQLALHALGPSYLYAFATSLLVDTWDHPGERHPPNCVRLSHMLETLNCLGWEAHINSRVPRLYEWLRGCASLTPKGGGVAGNFLLTAVKGTQASIRESSSTHLSDQVFRPSHFDQQAGDVAELATIDALPTQTAAGEPIDTRTILLSAWFAALEANDSPAQLASAVADIQAQAFLAKAIEMSALLSAWRGPQ